MFRYSNRSIGNFMIDWDDLVLVGRIARPHGLKGHVVVNPDTDFAEERFAEGSTLWTRSDVGLRQLVIKASRLQGNRPVVRFDGFDRVEDVERLAGLELRGPEKTSHGAGGGGHPPH